MTDAQSVDVPKTKPAAPAAKPLKARPTAKPARPKRRHYGVILSYAVLVLLPLLIWIGYLVTMARDQYASTVAFTVRREETPTATDILGGLANFSSASSSDSDILFEYIQSQELVKDVDDQLDLRKVYGSDYWSDPVFSLDPDAKIEDMVDYWRRMVQISYAPGTGLIEVEVKAFDPQDAQRIAKSIFERSSRMINDLSAIARQDAIRYAEEDLNTAVDQLKSAREAVTTFRSRNQIVDVGADIQAQMGLLSSLQQQLGAELINLDLLKQNTRDSDPRLTQTEQRIAAIELRIREERSKFGGSADGEDYAAVVAEYERLTVDREFAEVRYTNALSNYDTALANAQRQSRYLAAYVSPTLAESPAYPVRWLLSLIGALILFGGWSIAVLIYYSLRDRS